MQRLGFRASNQLGLESASLPWRCFLHDLQATTAPSHKVTQDVCNRLP